MDFIPAVTPANEPPLHLAPIIEAVEASLHREVRLVISTPPQHGKTQSLIHALVWLLRHNPKRHAYVSYNADRGEEISREMQWIADRAGISYSGNLGLWTTSDGGQLAATGIGGGLTGRPIDGLAVIDDSTKNREEAESLTMREKTDAWFKSVLLTRLHPGASVIVVNTRWHTDDLAGRLIGRGWDFINLPAISEKTGDALWPKRRPKEWLLKQKDQIGDYEWNALYCGNPRSVEGKLFRGVSWYDKLPNHYSVAIGVDLAYTAKTSSDFSVAVVMAESEGHWYILKVIRKQVETPKFTAELVALQSQYPGAPARWYTSTTEKGTADLVRALGGNLHGMRTHGDKFVRAQPVSAAWNRGRVHLPRKAIWLDDFVRVVTNFTGLDDPEDDDVDAMAAGFDLLPESDPAPIRLLPGTPEWQKAQEDEMRESAMSAWKQSREQSEEDAFWNEE